MICKKCASQIEDGAKFCNFCGAPVGSEGPVSTIMNKMNVAETTPMAAEPIKSVEEFEPQVVQPDNATVMFSNQNDYQQPQQGMYQQDAYQQPQQGMYQQDAYQQAPQNDYQQPQQGMYQQDAYQQAPQNDYQQPQQGMYQQDAYQQAPQNDYQQYQQDAYQQPQQNVYQQNVYQQAPQYAYQMPQQNVYQQNTAIQRDANKTGLASSAAVLVTSFVSLALCGFILFFPFFTLAEYSSLSWGFKVSNSSIFIMFIDFSKWFFGNVIDYGIGGLFDLPAYVIIVVFLLLISVICAVFAIIFQVCSIVNACMHTPYKDYKSAKKSFGTQMFLLPTNIVIILATIGISAGYVTSLALIIVVAVTMILHIVFLVVLGIQRSRTKEAFKAIDFINSTR